MIVKQHINSAKSCLTDFIDKVIKDVNQTYVYEI